MRIVAVEVVAVRVNHRGDWLHVRLVTDEGMTGIGEASHGGSSPQRDAIVAAIITQQCAPLLIGQDPCAVRATLQPLLALADGLAACTAVSACEQALWDLAGKAAGLPVYRLFGGPTRTRIPLYANINRSVQTRAPEEFARNAHAAVAEGFHAVKCAPFDGMKPATGTRTGSARPHRTWPCLCCGDPRGSRAGDRAIRGLPQPLRCAAGSRGGAVAPRSRCHMV